MTVSTTLVKTVVLVWMASTTSRVTALRGILGVTARQVFRGNYLVIPREDKGDREGIPHIHPIP